MAFIGQSIFSKEKARLGSSKTVTTSIRGVDKVIFTLALKCAPCVQWRSFRIEDEADFKPINDSNTPKTTFCCEVVYKKRCAFCQVAGVS
jgi:hypothetical protein